MHYPLSIPGLCAAVKVVRKSGKVHAVATAIDTESNTATEKLLPAVSRQYSERYEQSAINEAIAKLTRKYKKLYGEMPVSVKELDETFKQVKKAVFEEHFILHAKWKSESTNIQAIVFFERNTLPLLRAYAGTKTGMFLPSDRKDIENALAESIATRNGGDVALARETANKRMREANIIYSHMVLQNPRLPELKLVSDAPLQRVPKKEQIKHLSENVLRAFYAILRSLVSVAPKFVFFAVMVCYGMRPAEAAARCPSEIIWHDDYCVIRVVTQEVKGKLSSKLKNKYSYRTVVISYWGRQLLYMCCDQIKDDYPKPESGVPMNRAVECASRIKEILVNDCKCGEAVFEEAEANIDKDALDSEDIKDASGNLRSEKVSCYVLRRIFATLARGVMGLTLNETDRLMGHVATGQNGKKEAKLRCVDLNNEDPQQEIAEKMERHIFDPEISLNPSCSPYLLSHLESPKNLIEFSEIILTNNTDKPVVLECIATAAEMGEKIEIVMPNTATPALHGSSIPKSWSGIDRTVIGNTTLVKNKKGSDAVDQPKED